MLSDQEISLYHADGLVILSFRLPEATLIKLRNAISAVLLSIPENASDFMPYFADAAASLGVAQIPEVLDMVEQLIGKGAMGGGSLW